MSAALEGVCSRRTIELEPFSHSGALVPSLKMQPPNKFAHTQNYIRPQAAFLVGCPTEDRRASWPPAHNTPEPKASSLTTGRDLAALHECTCSDCDPGGCMHHYVSRRSSSERTRPLCSPTVPQQRMCLSSEPLIYAWCLAISGNTRRKPQASWPEVLV
ncbi:hypothetical protein OH76DRAFT_811618 [Lentinus brumalis]|uniref:Uncharacterized protein n=1 Tax=Lentinus brumalis TaxID=2498619 RepID=A0A371D317_9APHY|nr:hypothetical protein OH76DRAFT_811618 [Polyporus brumalis]